jgi:hypothetical protein
VTNKRRQRAAAGGGGASASRCVGASDRWALVFPVSVAPQAASLAAGSVPHPLKSFTWPGGAPGRCLTRSAAASAV